MPSNPILHESLGLFYITSTVSILLIGTQVRHMPKPKALKKSLHAI